MFQKNRFVFSVVALAVSQLLQVSLQAVYAQDFVPSGEGFLISTTAVPAPNSEASSSTIAPTAPALDSNNAPAAESALQPPNAAPEQAPTSNASGLGGLNVLSNRELQPRILRGNDAVIAQPKLPDLALSAPTSFRFENAPIANVIHTVLNDIVKTHYVLHQPIAGSVTLATRSEVTADQAVFLLEAALQANGLQMVRDPRGFFHVGKPDVLKAIVPAMRVVQPQKPLPPGSGVVIVPLQYIGAAEMAKILRPMVPAEALLQIDTVRNLIVLAGSRTQAEGWLDIVSTFDVNLLKGMSIGVFPLKYISIKDLEDALRLFLDGSPPAAPSSSGAPATPTAPTPPRGVASAAAASNAASRSTESFSLFSAVRMMPIERINSVLVVTPRAAYLDEARAWIEQLDKPGVNSSEPELFVYPVQNGNAKHLASVLNNLFGGNLSSVPSGVTGVAPGLSQSGLTGNSFGGGFGGGGFGGGGFGGSGFGANNANQNNFMFGNRPGQATAQPGVSSASLGANGPRIVADEVNNSLLVFGTRNDFLKIENTLKRLDLPPTQVLIEASIIEITLTDSLTYGLQWAFSQGASFDGRGFSGNGQLGSPTPITGNATSNFSYALSAGGQVRALLTALADKGLVNVISSPTIMVQDNYPAAISVGTQEPIQTGETTPSTGGSSKTYQLKDVGVNLQVTPSVNAGNMVSMTILQSLSSVGATNETTKQTSFDNRQLTSKVAIRSGETLVLGGLISDQSTSGKSGVPFLSQIPVLGALFGQHARKSTRRELLVIITPRVVRSDQELRDLSIEFRDRMQGFVGFDASSEAKRRVDMIGLPAGEKRIKPEEKTKVPSGPSTSLSMGDQGNPPTVNPMPAPAPIAAKNTTKTPAKTTAKPTANPNSIAPSPTPATPTAPKH